MIDGTEIGTVNLSAVADGDDLRVTKLHARGPLAEFETRGSYGLVSRDLHVEFLVAARG